ncbi:hypothetical protein CYMTET_52399 [Cymbomonas tetramitiformis]|uniref:Uncharacterized protein n=1 Tax=Cymbomonas tetramitiformis TaxID=36881 RepID=A0AAE0ERD5_9CHLO|nr:hypothetical protein CYMTET_52399 [Cymbomonas tetramitiformis]
MSNENIFDALTKRSAGDLGSPQRFRRTAGSCPGLLRRMTLQKELEGHRGCVNTVSFISSGDVLVSGSDDQQVMLWDWKTGERQLTYHSGHSGNVFQARLLPESGNVMVTLGADGRVRVGHLPQGGAAPETREIGKHRGCAHKLGIMENSPNVFLSCGEDGHICQYDLRQETPFTSMLVARDANSCRIGLNAISCNPCNSWQVAACGADPHVLVYDIRSLATPPSDRGIVEQDRGEPSVKPVRWIIPDAIKNNNGHMHMHMSSVVYSQNGEILGSYNREKVYLFAADGCRGNRAAVLNRDGEEEEGGSADDGSFEGHRNAATVKGVSFFGPSDEYVLSGSDCGHLFWWSKRDGVLQQLLKGDEHVVNCLEPHPTQPLALASSGIDNTVKKWGPTADAASFDQAAAKSVMEENAAREADDSRGPMFHISPQLLLRYLQATELTRSQQAGMAGRGELTARGFRVTETTVGMQEAEAVAEVEITINDDPGREPTLEEHRRGIRSECIIS